MAPLYLCEEHGLPQFLHHPNVAIDVVFVLEEDLIGHDLLCSVLDREFAG